MKSNQACILVVDDNEMNRDLITRRLQRQGYETMSAENGRVAITLLENHCFDLILLDIMMPVMNGYEVLELVKKHPKWQYIPIIVISAADDMRSVVKGIELGAEDYLPKPFNPMLLKARIRASLEKKRLYDREQARMAELATMQTVDAQLNATLDAKRAMEITLEWAMSYSQAEAGILGEIIDGQINVLAAQGYSYETAIDNNQFLLPDELPAVKEACMSGNMSYVPETNGVGLLARTQSQLAIPIKREKQIMAMLLLESSTAKRWDHETMMFLQRLCTHAAIAIANGKLYEVVQSANNAKTEFVSFVSHELKTPMTTIKGYTDLLVTGSFGEVNETQTSFLNTVRANVERMSRLVSDLEDVSRIEAGHLELETDLVSLQELIDEVMHSTMTQIDAKEQTLQLDIPSDLPPVWGDRTRLVQIFTNLVSNAYKYTPENGRITISANETSEVTEQDDEMAMVHVSVSDTGLGIREEDQEGIFDKFFRASDELAKKSPGTGLGLNITKNLVEMHNGRIWFESEFRKGTVFHVMIPAVLNGQKTAGVQEAEAVS
ncbi:MAG: response regulator [Chloroflexota bacterium]